MARKLRIEYPGAVYHVMSRGNQGGPIFRDDKDSKVFLETLGQACEKTGWWVHAYVLMGNHYHLLLETPEANLVAGMKWLQGTYTQRFNARHRVFGHLVQGRYKALVVDGEQENYFGLLATYIHLNPVRAKRVRPPKQRLKSYGWSSYPAYLAAATRRPAWLRVDRVLGALGFRAGDRVSSRRGFESYCESRALECLKPKNRSEWDAEWRPIRRGWFLGDGEFKERLLAHIRKVTTGRRRASRSGAAVADHGEAAARRMLAAGRKALGCEDRNWRRMPKAEGVKEVLAWWLRSRTTVSCRWISEQLCMGHESSVSRAVRRVANARGRQVRAWKRELPRYSAREGRERREVKGPA